MRITVTQFRGLVDLRASVAPILLLAGPNGAGKSSACAAIAAAASGTLLPFDGLTKKTAALLVRDGADLASVMLKDGDAMATATWPATERSAVGGWRDISAVAAGLVDVAALKAAERAAMLIELIGAMPTADDLRKAMAARAISQPVVDEAMKCIAGGWDAAHARFKDGGAKLKGRWEQATGTRYGKQKADGWRPIGWLPTMEAMTAEEHAEIVAAAECALEVAAQNAGAGQAQMDTWQAEACKLPQYERELAAAQVDHEAQIKAGGKAREFLISLGTKPNPGSPPLLCPCCDAALRMKDGALVSAGDEDFAEMTGAATAWDAAKAEADRASERINLALRYVQSAEQKVVGARAAAESLAKAAEVESTATTQADIDQVKAALAVARSAADMRRRVTDASALAEQIAQVATVTDMLDKTGLRQEWLASALGAFNSDLVQVCASAGWAPVHVDADMGVSYGGRPVALCSAGEQFRARISLQLAIAAAEGAAFVVIDGADILDKAGRNGLFRMLNDLGARAVIGMTLLKREDMPDLSRTGLGESIWIEQGRGETPVREAA